MNIKRAKQEIRDSIEAYLAKDEFGCFLSCTGICCTCISSCCTYRRCSAHIIAGSITGLSVVIHTDPAVGTHTSTFQRLTGKHSRYKIRICTGIGTQIHTLHCIISLILHFYSNSAWCLLCSSGRIGCC